ASLVRPARAGLSAEWAVTLELPPLERDGEKADLRLDFLVEGQGAFGLGIVREMKAGKEASDLRVLFSGNATDGKRITRVLRTFPWPDGFHQGEWRLRWPHGLLDVRRAGKRVAVGHIEQATQPLLAVRWLQITGSARCLAMRLDGAAPARLTAEQAREL